MNTALQSATLYLSYNLLGVEGVKNKCQIDGSVTFKLPFLPTLIETRDVIDRHENMAERGAFPKSVREHFNCLSSLRNNVSADV